MEEDNTQYFNDEWNTERPVFINEIEQVNIGTIDKPYYLPKPTEEQIEIYTERFKQLYDNKYTK